MMTIPGHTHLASLPRTSPHPSPASHPQSSSVATQSHGMPADSQPGSCVRSATSRSASVIGFERTLASFAGDTQGSRLY